MGVYILIITDKVLAVCSGRNLAHYKNKGYIIPYTIDKRGRIGVKKGTKILVDVLDVHPTSQIKIRYKCDDCGIEKEVVAQSLFSRKNSQYSKTMETICSNCANSRMKGENNSQYKHGCNRYSEYRHNSKRRGIEFNLTSDEFKKIISQECHYCGGFSIDYNPQSRGNGIDRKDNNIGYVIDNCLPCCSKCNFIKNSMPYSEFIKYIKRIYNKIQNYQV